MKSHLLKQAQNYEAIYSSRISPEERPLFHVTPAVGWLNDPNRFLRIVSPMEMIAEGLEFHNGNNAAYITGCYDENDHTFVRTKLHCLGYGLDFYAPQTLLTPDGRRILIGWMQSPETGHSQPHDIK